MDRHRCTLYSPLIQYIEFQHNEDSTMEHEDYLDSLTREFVFITGIIHMFFLDSGDYKTKTTKVTAFLTKPLFVSMYPMLIILLKII